MTIGQRSDHYSHFGGTAQQEIGTHTHAHTHSKGVGDGGGERERSYCGFEHTLERRWQGTASEGGSFQFPTMLGKNMMFLQSVKQLYLYSRLC